jgi:hypothetical protein
VDRTFLRVSLLHFSASQLLSFPASQPPSLPASQPWRLQPTPEAQIMREGAGVGSSRGRGGVGSLTSLQCFAGSTAGGAADCQFNCRGPARCHHRTRTSASESKPRSQTVGPIRVVEIRRSTAELSSSSGNRTEPRRGLCTIQEYALSSARRPRMREVNSASRATNRLYLSEPLAPNCIQCLLIYHIKVRIEEPQRACGPDSGALHKAFPPQRSCEDDGF